MNLIWIYWRVEDPPNSMEGISDDYYMIDIEAGDCLIYAVLDSE